MLLPNETAFLATIRHSEGTDRQPNPYAVVFGFEHVIADFSNHPAVTGEWPGVHYAGGLSTAAGAYQIIKETWMRIMKRLSLPDFSPASQDLAALELIRERDALDLVQSGDIEHAIWLCSSTWASFPGSLSGQPQKTVAMLTDAFSSAGGTLAA